MDGETVVFTKNSILAPHRGPMLTSVHRSLLLMDVHVALVRPSTECIDQPDSSVDIE